MIPPMFRFNPCFNGTMYKTGKLASKSNDPIGFNPCFNGTMYKTLLALFPLLKTLCFNPCFNGTMYKTGASISTKSPNIEVSILVLMELCIKHSHYFRREAHPVCFNPCFNGTMYKTRIYHCHGYFRRQFQSLF